MYSVFLSLWPMKTLDPDSLALILKMAEGVVVFVFASKFVFTWVIPIVCLCACACSCACTSLMKTRLDLRKACYISTGVVEEAGF